MFCVKCGNKIDETKDKFCSKCGISLFHYCPSCGVKILDNHKYCPNCAAHIIATNLFEVQGLYTNYEHNETEEDICKNIIEDLGVDSSLFSFSKHCKEYTTLKYKDNDIARIKYTSGARWIKILISNDSSKIYMDSPLFDAQQNKRQAFWKSNIKSIYDYKDVLLYAIKSVDYWQEKDTKKETGL